MITKFITWLFGLFIHEAVEQVKEEAKKPDTIEDAKTDPKLRADWDAFLDRKLTDRRPPK